LLATEQLPLLLLLRQDMKSCMLAVMRGIGMSTRTGCLSLSLFAAVRGEFDVCAHRSLACQSPVKRLPCSVTW